MVRGERRVETLTTAKTANTPTHMRLRTEHPRERLRTDSLAKRLSQGFRCWSERKSGFNWLYPKPKGRIESEPRGPSKLRGVRGVSTNHTVPVTNRHGSSWFESFRSHFALFWSFWLAISEPGWTSRKKSATWSPAHISETKPHAAVVSYNH